MKLAHIRSYIALAKRKHFGMTAKALKISQPALSQQLKQLETELGAELVLRERGNLTLTPAGEEFLVHARRIANDVAQAKNAIANARGKAHGVLRIGHSPSHHAVAVAAVVRLLGRSPELRVSIEELLSPHIEARIRDGRLDLGLVHAWAPTEGIEHRELTSAPLRLIVHPDHALADAREVTHLSTLANQRFVLARKGMRSRRVVDAYFQGKDFRPRIAAESNAMASLFALVRSLPTLMTVLPVPVPHVADLRGLSLLNLPEPVPMQGSFLIWRAPPLLSDAARKFQDAIQAILTELPPDSSVTLDSK